MSRTIAFVLAPGVHLLDVAGPAQAFSAVADVVGNTRWQPRYVADSESVQSHQGLLLSAETAMPKLCADDLIVIPGWRQDPTAGCSARLSTRLLQQITAHHAAGGEVMSVCAGAFALAEAGLLDGRRATTHHDLQDDLARRYPRVEVIKDVLYVSDGRIFTSAGIASGIDLALHRIEERLGARVAARVARALVVYARRNGDALQESVMLAHRDHLDDMVHRVQDVIDERFAESLPLAELAGYVHVSERTLTRAFHRALGTTPLRYQQALRRERAEQLIGSGVTVESAAAEVGFDDARMLRRLRQTTSQDGGRLPAGS